MIHLFNLVSMCHNLTIDKYINEMSWTTPVELRAVDILYQAPQVTLACLAGPRYLALAMGPIQIYRVRGPIYR